MCTLIAEIIMIVGGIFALIQQRVKMTANLTVEGKAARITGLILIIAGGLAMLGGFALGFAGALLHSEIVVLAPFFEIGAIVLGLAAAVYYAGSHKSTPSTPLTEDVPLA
jgi:hypothetical protein